MTFDKIGELQAYRLKAFSDIQSATYILLGLADASGQICRLVASTMLGMSVDKDSLLSAANMLLVLTCLESYLSKKSFSVFGFSIVGEVDRIAEQKSSDDSSLAYSIHGASVGGSNSRAQVRILLLSRLLQNYNLSLEDVMCVKNEVTNELN